MRRWRAGAAIVATGIVLAACGSQTEPARSGQTIDRAAVAKYSYEMNNYGVCLLKVGDVCTMYQQVTYDEGPYWYVLVEDCQHGDGGSCRRSIWQVPQRVYDQAQAPMAYQADKKADPVTDLPTSCPDDTCRGLKRLLTKITK